MFDSTRFTCLVGAMVIVGVGISVIFNVGILVDALVGR
jgi:hypothetical protein